MCPPSAPAAATPRSACGAVKRRWIRESAADLADPPLGEPVGGLGGRDAVARGGPQDRQRRVVDPLGPGAGPRRTRNRAARRRPGSRRPRSRSSPGSRGRRGPASRRATSGVGELVVRAAADQPGASACARPRASGHGRARRGRRRRAARASSASVEATARTPRVLAASTRRTAASSTSATTDVAPSSASSSGTRCRPDLAHTADADQRARPGCRGPSGPARPARIPWKTPSGREHGGVAGAARRPRCARSPSGTRGRRRPCPRHRCRRRRPSRSGRSSEATKRP